jgi:hypothetical protein
MSKLSQQLHEEEGTLHETYNTELFELRQQYRQKQDELLNRLL